MVTDARIPVARFCDSAHAGQVAALRAFDEGRARFVHLIWHRRARKTSLVINLMIREALKHRNRTYRHILPKRTQAEEVVWNDPNMLFSYLPPVGLGLWKSSVSNLTITFKTGSRIVLDGADKLADARRGISGHGFALDEWAFHENTYVFDGLIQPILAEGADRWCWFITTFNGLNHAHQMYTDAVREASPDTYCDMLKASTSGLLSQVELDKRKKAMPRALYLQEFECEPVSADNMVLIQPHLIERLQGIHYGRTQTRRIIACDPAFGGDAGVLMAIENTKVIEKRTLHPSLTSEIVGELHMMGSRTGIRNYVIDDIGIGRGVCDGMMEDPAAYVQRFTSSEKPTNPNVGDTRLFNRRAEAWWYAFEEVAAGRAEYMDDPVLRRQLASVCYKIASTGAIQMEDKDNVRKRLGRSPDDADCFVMGLWGLKNTDPIHDGERYSSRRMFVPAGAGMGAMGA